MKRFYIVFDNYSMYTRITLPLMLQKLGIKTIFLDGKTDIEVNQLRIGAMTCDPLHPESWRECVDIFLDAIRTILFFSSGRHIRFLIILPKLLDY